MDHSMTARLILSKMNTKNAAKRPLCLVINRAVAYLDHFEQKEAGLRLQFIEGLAGEAARTLRLADVADCLVTDIWTMFDNLEWDYLSSITKWRANNCSGREPQRRPVYYISPSSPGFKNSLSQVALIAALSTKRFDLAKRVLDSGVESTIETHAFGIPLQIAAALGAHDIVQVVLEELVRRDKKGDAGAFGTIMKARQLVLYGAAEGGQEVIIRMVLNHKDYRVRPLKPVIHLAIENGHDDIALLVLQHGFPLTSQKNGGTNPKLRVLRELQFLEYLSKKASRYGCSNTTKTALDIAACVRRDKMHLLDKKDKP
jgi:hypothetical protein